LMRKHPTPQVRTKFLTAWDFYKQRYPEMLRVLEQRRFSLSALAQSNAWRGESSAMRQDIRYFRRIGSGSSLSLQLTRRKRGSVPSSLVT
jgi:hypothetical protein